MKHILWKEAKEMAKAAGFDGVSRVGTWKGREVYEPIFTDGEPHFVGLPSFIISEGGKLRWTADPREAFAVMDALTAKNRTP